MIGGFDLTAVREYPVAAFDMAGNADNLGMTAVSEQNGESVVVCVVVHDFVDFCDKRAGHVENFRFGIFLNESRQLFFDGKRDAVRPDDKDRAGRRFGEHTVKLIFSDGDNALFGELFRDGGIVNQLSDRMDFSVRTRVYKLRYRVDRTLYAEAEAGVFSRFDFHDDLRFPPLFRFPVFSRRCAWKRRRIPPFRLSRSQAHHIKSACR